MSSPKTIDDLPHFLISGIKSGRKRSDEYIDFELSGTFDKVEGVEEGRCSLLLPELNCFLGDLKLLNPAAKTAVYVTSALSEPAVLGSSLPYVNDTWQAYEIWMVTEPLWIWDRVPFQASDGIGRRYEADQPRMIDGKEVREWIEVKKTADRGKARYYPIYPGRAPRFAVDETTGVIKGGWEHEHCDLCHTHIEPGEHGYVDRSDHWVCEKCYTKYVVPHDLSFLDGMD